MTVPAAGAAIHVLLVEDNPGDARLIFEMLNEVDLGMFEVEGVDHLSVALARLEHAGIDVVLLDLGLPDSQGLDTFLRTQNGAPHEPIVVISGLDDERLALDAVRAGAQDYLVKGRVEGPLLARVLRYAIERKRAETALAASESHYRASEQRFRELAENVREVFFVVDPVTGVAQYVNPAYETVFGHSREYAYNTPYAWTETIHPDDREIALSSERTASQAGQPSTAEFRIVRPDKSIRWIRGQAAPVRDATGEIIRLVGIAEDVTDLKRAEQQFREAQKMEAVGRLAGGVAHDFNNLLTVIMSYGELQAAEFRTGDGHREDLDEIVAAAKRASELTKQLLAFSRQQVLEPQVLDLNILVRNVSKMLRRLIGEDIDLIAKLAPKLGAVRADPGELEQVLMNLVVNARDAMPNGGMVTIETTNVDLSEEFAGIHESVAPGAYTVLSVSDSGEGMSDATKARIFEPFFTTKERGKGTGLGLASVFGIVKQSGGYLWVYSELGRGTALKIYLPRVTAPADALRERDAPAIVRGGSETILVVEDEPAVRAVIKTVLGRRGYTVIEAARPDIALALPDTLPCAPDLMMTDVILPGLNGRELARALEAKWPGLKVLYVSGYTDEAIVRHGVLEPGVSFLEKPFSPDGLSRKVRQVLDEGA
jgi:two-component system cell cycle sensor histidine kinase/response regulator CckA